MDTILLCLDGQDEDGRLRAAADMIARELDIEVSVVRIAGGSEPCRPSPGGWTLRTADPGAPLLNFARFRRARCLLFSPRAWKRWGKATRAAMAGLECL